MAGQFDDERKAIESRFQTMWAGTAADRVQFQNKVIEPGDGPWVALFVLPGQGRITTLGSSPRRQYDGTIVVQVFVRLGAGARPALALADQVDTIFFNASFACGATGLITCYAPAIREIGDEGNGWYQVNVEIPFNRHQY